MLLLLAACPGGSPLGKESPPKSEASGTTPLNVVFFGNPDDEARRKAQSRGAQMAAALTPALAGRDIEYRYGGSPTGRALARAAGDPDVVAAITVGGESAIRDAAVALDEHLLPVFEVADDLYEAGQLRSSVFQMKAPHSWTSWRLARYFGPGDRAYKKVAILRESFPDSDFVAGALRLALEERGVEMIDARVAPRSTESEIASEVEKLSQAKPQAVVLEGSEQFVSQAARVLNDAKWRYRGRAGTQSGGWRPQVAGFETMLLANSDLAEGTVAAGDYALAFPPSESMERIESFVKGFRERFDERPRADEYAAYDAVRLTGEAIRRAGKLDRREVLATLESFDRQQFVHTPVSFAPSDHVAAERDVQGLWTVKKGSEGLSRSERWTHLMRAFTSDLERTNILEEDWPSFFEGTKPGGEAPFFYQARSGVVSKREDDIH